MYCGDETGSFVGQVGSRTSRFGYGGDEAPRVVLPSYVGQFEDGSGPSFVPASCYRKRWAEANVWKNPLSGPTYTSTDGNHGALTEAALSQPVLDPAAYLSQGGAIVDWDAYETLWKTAMETMQARRLKHTTGEERRAKNSTTTTTTETTTTTIATTTTTETETTTTTPASTTIRPTAPEYACMHPLLAVTSGFTYPSLAADGTYSSTAVKAARRRERGHLIEFLLEDLDAPACFISPEPMVQAFSQGRSTALIVDVGAGGTRVTPIVDGLILSTAQRRSGRGGDWLLNTAWQALHSVTPLRPRYQLHYGVIDPSIQARRGIFHRWAMQDLLWEVTSTVSRLAPPSPSADMPSTVLFASSRTKHTRNSKNNNRDGQMQDNDSGNDDKDSSDENDPHDKDHDDNHDDDDDDEMDTDEPVSATVPNATYELPDGTLVDLSSPVGRDLCRLPEAYFMEQLPHGISPNASILAQHYTLCDMPIDKLIQSSLLAIADVDVRKDCMSNILLVGGGSFGLEERLSWQLRQLLPVGKPKVLATSHEIERTAAGWIGGSILSSLGSFQQLWLGRTEYEEYGTTLALQRFPV